MRTSEVRVEIYRNGKLDEMLEFFVFRDGEILVTVEEVVEWFEQQLTAIR